MKNSRYYFTKAELVWFLKDSAQYILDNAEDIVGNYRVMTGLDVVIKVCMDELPTVNVERRYLTGGWNARREFYGDYVSNSDNDSSGSDTSDPGDAERDQSSPTEQDDKGSD